MFAFRQKCCFCFLITNIVCVTDGTGWHCQKKMILEEILEYGIHVKMISTFSNLLEDKFFKVIFF